MLPTCDERVLALVVDDNPDFAGAVREVLESIIPSVVVHAAESASEALTFLEGCEGNSGIPQPAFAVVDFYLPDMNGPALLERLRSSPLWRNLPVLAVSQANWEGEGLHARTAGANRFRVKPSRASGLREVLLSFCAEEVQDLKPH
jgi:CheY-like chemotaxis protein